ncbi:hypothetical protein [Thalassomonas sp. M1454]|uniref:hypothetical protein n=1 Tax=Thalassomonas sp. M1454 TaxID=2594477 RepID=UPI00163D4754|nr:hypothetical protein [Thalassomonas sp. M1454]
MRTTLQGVRVVESLTTSLKTKIAKSPVRMIEKISRLPVVLLHGISSSAQIIENTD